MDTQERKLLEQPSAAADFRGKFSSSVFGFRVGQPKPAGRKPSNLRIESRKGLVTALHYELWDPPNETFEVCAEEISSWLGAEKSSRTQPRETRWRAKGVEARLSQRMLDPGLKFTLTVTPAPETAEPEASVEEIKAEFEDTFSELENVQVSQTDSGYRFAGDLRESEFAGVLVEWTGPARVDGGLHPDLVDRVLEELRSAQEEDEQDEQ